MISLAFGIFLTVILFMVNPVAAQRLQSEVAHDTALAPASMMVVTGCEAKDFDGAALPRAVSTEGDAVRCAATLSGVPYVMLVSEDGSLTIYQVEDAAHVSGHAGIMPLAVRNDTHTTALSGTDGDYTPLATDSTGKLGIRGTYAEDAAHVTGDLGLQLLTVRQDTAAALAGTDGDYQPPITDSTGRLWSNTELPDAAALADAASATPTTPTAGVIPLLMNATTVDRQRAVVNALNSVGTGIAASGTVLQFDDVAPGALTENNFGPWRGSSRREGYIQVRDAAGNERGANVNASNELTVSAAVTSFPDNEPFNAAQWGGVAVLGGSGVTGAGSPRISISTDANTVAAQATVTALTDGLSNSVTQPIDNQSRQLNYQTFPMLYNNTTWDRARSGVGVTGIGVQRVVLADNDPCQTSGRAKSSVVLNVTTSAQVIAASGSTIIYICGFTATVGGTAPTYQFVYGTGSVCATVQVTLSGVFAPTVGSFNTYSPGMTAFSTIASQALCILTGGTTPSVQGVLTYIQQ